MFRKIIFNTLIFCFALVSIAQSSEGGGMPQLDPEFWISQIFWLILTFGILFIVLSKFILPKISKSLAEKEINDLKGKSPEKIKKIAIEASSDLVKNLIGTELNNSSISAIVEDISNKNKGKYYGI